MILNVVNQEHVRQTALRKRILRPIGKAYNNILPAIKKHTGRECLSTAIAPKPCTLKNEILVLNELKSFNWVAENLVLSSKVIRVELPTWKIWEADFPSVFPRSIAPVENDVTPQFL